MRLYVAGKMTGVPDFNAPAFRHTTKVLRGMGHEVLSPVEFDEAEGFDHAGETEVAEGEYLNFLRRDLLRILEADVDGVVVIDGWEKSRGAALEVHVARELGKPVYRLIPLSHGDLGHVQPARLEPVKAPSAYQPPSNETVLETAARLVDGDRGETYGHPAEDFERTAGAWRALFGWDVDARRVALAMVCVKLSRLVQSPEHRDSVIDTAGYARTYEAVLAREGAKAFQDLGPSR